MNKTAASEPEDPVAVPEEPRGIRVSIEEIMATLEVGRDYAYNLLRSDELKTRRIRPGGPHLLLRPDWEDFLAGR